MCGIAGIFNSDGITPDSSQVVQQMLNVMKHRGPDGEGIHRDPRVCLGHVRLSIIDVEGSVQPLANENETIWVTFNGEIYNYADLRQELKSKGHVFRTNGDTETLVHLYEEKGPEMVHSLQGMFSFAIWDSTKKELFIARDRMGIKPLYYATQGETFYFASEPKAILQSPEVQFSLNQNVLWEYLTYRSVSAPSSLFKYIYKLPPGHSILINGQGQRITSYWDISLIPESQKEVRHKSVSGYIQEVEELLTTSVRRRMIADVPLGSFLSGGVDSSLIVAIMSKLSDFPIKTYSVGFDNFPSSELPYARVVSELYKTDHHELVLKDSVFSEYLEPLTWIRDAPLSEPADIPLHLLSKMACRDVKVLLSGEGSDETYGGYPKYAYDSFAGVLSSIPSSWLRMVARLLPESWRRVEVALRSLVVRDHADRWAQWFSPFTMEQKLQILRNCNNMNIPTRQYLANTDGCSPLDSMLYADCKIWLPENLLDRADRMTMGASVEGRVPFLDHEFVENAFSNPSNLKVRGMHRKWLIKKIAEKYLPSEIVYRKKAGFVVPLSQWFRGPMKELCYEMLCGNQSLSEELFSKSSMRKLLDEHCSMRKDHFFSIWTLLGLSLWWKVFNEKSSFKVSV